MKAWGGEFVGYQFIVVLLDQVRRRWRAVMLLQGALIWVSVLLAGLIGCCLLAGWWMLVWYLRGAMLAGLIVGALGGPLVMLWRFARSDRSDLYYARFTEQHLQLRGNELTNAVMLVESGDLWSRPLLNRVIDQCCQTARRVRPEDVAPLKIVKPWAISTLAVTLFALLMVALAGPTMAQGFKSILNPTMHVPRAGLWQIKQVIPGDAEIVTGQSLAVQAHLNGPKDRQIDVQMVIVSADGLASTYRMQFDIHQQLGKFEIPAVQENFDYYVRAGDAVSPLYAVGVKPRLIVTGVDMVYRYPGYLGMGNRIIADHRGPIEVPEGTEVEWTLRLGTPAAGGEIVFAGGERLKMSAQAAGMIFAASYRPGQDDRYAILITDITGRQVHRMPGGGNQDAAGEVLFLGRDDRYWPIRIIADAQPKVQIVSPGSDLQVAAGGELELVVAASDDLGLEMVEVFFSGLGGSEQLLSRWSLDGKKQAWRRFVWQLASDQYAPGQKLIYWARACDRRDLGPDRGRQCSDSNKYSVELIDPQVARRQRSELLEDLLGKLHKLLKLQIGTRADTLRLALRVRSLIVDSSALGRDIADRQRDIDREIKMLAGDRRYGPQSDRIIGLLKLLAQGHSPHAVRIAESIVQLARQDDDKIVTAAEQLADQQELIIQVLQSLLGMIDPGIWQQPSTGPDRQKQGQARLFAQLGDNLSAFVVQQRSVLVDTLQLAAGAIEDFTDADDAKLDQLSNVEEQWEKFLRKSVDDLDRLADQDFSSAVVRQELIEIISDVQMAKDALEQKAVTMAVSAEQVSLELAEELLTNLERWLPDSPDRLKWELEQPDMPIDVPLAELPGELVDIIGELLEQEEDLYDQLEDITSAWADSLDKGAGWKASDGPISNFSAKGVTGNVLPNANEIGGRAGEGRTGRTSGEMVEDTVTGKGGRRTPTRLTGDAFQRSQVRDLSGESAGGATGGGKLAGAAGQGLEGPLPKQLLDDLEGLAGQQATLRNKSEKFKVQFNQARLDHLRLDQIVGLMDRNARELSQGTYRNMLRRKRVLISSLRTAKLLAGNNFSVQADRPPRLSKRFDQQLNWPQPTEFPPTFRRLLKDYYQTLSEPTQ